MYQFLRNREPERLFSWLVNLVVIDFTKVEQNFFNLIRIVNLIEIVSRFDDKFSWIKTPANNKWVVLNLQTICFLFGTALKKREAWYWWTSWKFALLGLLQSTIEYSLVLVLVSRRNDLRIRAQLRPRKHSDPVVPSVGQRIGGAAASNYAPTGSLVGSIFCVTLRESSWDVGLRFPATSARPDGVASSVSSSDSVGSVSYSFLVGRRVIPVLSCATIGP